MNLDNLKSKLGEDFFKELKVVSEKYQINTPLRLSHFLGQCHHESGGFKVTEENLNYSADRLLVVFPKYFKNKDISQYNRNPEKIANLVYANRMGNGDEASGDGFKYKGRGYIQITGKNNYTEYLKTNIADYKSLSTTLALDSAGWFFNKAGLNKISDLGVTDTIITRVTKLINGGTHGLDDRIKLTKYYYDLINK